MLRKPTRTRNRIKNKNIGDKICSMGKKSSRVEKSILLSKNNTNVINKINLFILSSLQLVSDTL